jgi:hypothetical protein
MNHEEDSNAQFPAAGDPHCTHRSHYECVSCRKLACARCSAELAAPTDVWRTTGYWCSECRERKP